MIGLTLAAEMFLDRMFMTKISGELTNENGFCFHKLSSWLRLYSSIKCLLSVETWKNRPSRKWPICRMALYIANNSRPKHFPAILGRKRIWEVIHESYAGVTLRVTGSLHLRWFCFKLRKSNIINVRQVLYLNWNLIMKFQIAACHFFLFFFLEEYQLRINFQ